jgi:hypothetical protein
MTRAFAGAVLMAALAGCASSADTAGLLEGQWGGPNMQVVARRSGVVVSLACIDATFTGPIPIGPDGQITAVGTVTAASWSGGLGTAARITGTVVDGTANIQFNLQDSAGNWNTTPLAFRVTRGQAVSWPDGQECLV